MSHENACPVCLEEFPSSLGLAKHRHPELEQSFCRVCNVEIGTAELCEKCSVGNDPFKSSKYREPR